MGRALTSPPDNTRHLIRIHHQWASPRPPLLSGLGMAARVPNMGFMSPNPFISKRPVLFVQHGRLSQPTDCPIVKQAP